jgi:DNA-binding CsgD family transcriptional regulator
MNHADLTPAERRVLQELLRVRTHADAARQLGVALSTVRSHVRNIHRETDTHTMAELVRWAMKQARAASTCQVRKGKL